MLSLNLQIRYSTSKQNDRREIFNFKDIESQKIFFQNTNKSNNLSKLFQTNDSIEVKAKQFGKNLIGLFQKCFKKKRIVKGQKLTEIDFMMTLREKLARFIKTAKCKLAIILAKRSLDEIEGDFSVHCSEKNVEKIKNYMGEMCNIEGGFSSSGMWNIMKRIYPKARDPPMAK